VLAAVRREQSTTAVRLVQPIDEILSTLNLAIAPFYIPDEQEDLIRDWAENQSCQLLSFRQLGCTLYLSLKKGKKERSFTIGLKD
jgi:hypothetical protein